MLMGGGNVRIFLAFQPVDMRLAFDGLAAKVKHELDLDPYGGDCFVFRSKSGARLKILLWDGVGFWLHYRRLEQGTLIWPPVNDRGVIELTQAQFTVLTQGLDWRRVRYAQQLAPMLA
jgi:transposase